MNDAGKMLGPVTVQRIAAGGGQVLYADLRKSWAAPRQTGKMAVFAKSGVGADEWEFTMREGDVSPGDVVIWRGITFLVTNVRENGRHPVWLEIKAARIPYQLAQLQRTIPQKNDRGITEHVMQTVEQLHIFLTEKYYGESAERDHRVTKTQMIAEVPRVSGAIPGDLLVIDGMQWRVMTLRDLSPYKKDLEIELVTDV